MAQCISPFYKKDTGMSFPCGKCLYCRQRRASGWSFRLIQHMRSNPLASFVTLTYNSDHVPFSKKNRMTLVKKDIQLWLKRLRIYQERKLDIQFKRGYLSKYYGKKIMYYCAGEYGSKYGRPHYHLILWNADPCCVISTWTDNEKKPIGSIYFGQVTPASVGYTLKYISKEAKVPQYFGDDRLPEFQLMSKGLGLDYLSDNVKKYHLEDLFGRCYVSVKDSDIKIAMPRYYKERIYTSLERTMIGDAVQSKILHQMNWLPDPDAKYELFRSDEYKYHQNINDLFLINKLKNELSQNKDSIF